MSLPKPYYEEPGITIYCGDCRDILPYLEPVDLVLTDPPYQVGFSEFEKHFDFKWWLETFPNFGNVAFTCGIRNLHIYPKPRWIYCWAKPGSTRRNDTGGFNCWEPVLYYGNRKIMTDFIYLPDCVNHTVDGKDHPCPKPLPLWMWLVERFSNEGDLILDPMIGSGTTALAAKQLHRNFIGIEISQKYCDIARERLRQEVLL